jgi:hypothetical protein
MESRSVLRPPRYESMNNRHCDAPCCSNAGSIISRSLSSRDTCSAVEFHVRKRITLGRNPNMMLSLLPMEVSQGVLTVEMSDGDAVVARPGRVWRHGAEQNGT